MKRKKFKLHRTRAYSPVIAVIGGRSYKEHMPIDYGTTIPQTKDKPEKIQKGFSRIMKKRGIFKKVKSEE